MPTFSNARYLFSREDWLRSNKEVDPHFGDIFADSIHPIIDAGLCDLIDSQWKIADEVCLIPTPGHTPGDVSVQIESKGRRALITGDAIHHPLQCARPDFVTHFCASPAVAVSTRRQLLAQVADQPILVLGKSLPHARLTKYRSLCWTQNFHFECDTDTAIGLDSARLITGRTG